jgi:hypothetical protein
VILRLLVDRVLVRSTGMESSSAAKTGSRIMFKGGTPASALGWPPNLSLHIRLFPTIRNNGEEQDR